MATFVKVGAKTKALIRKQGYPTRSKTFVRYADAQAWAKKLESEMERGCFDDSALLKQFHFSEALEEYLESCRHRNLKATKPLHGLLQALVQEYADMNCTIN